MSEDSLAGVMARKPPCALLPFLCFLPSTVPFLWLHKLQGSSLYPFASLCSEVTGMLAYPRLPRTSALSIYADPPRSDALTSTFIPVSSGTHKALWVSPQVPWDPSPSTPKHIWVQPANHKHRGWGKTLPHGSHTHLLKHIAPPPEGFPSLVTSGITFTSGWYSAHEGCPGWAFCCDITP